MSEEITRVDLNEKISTNSFFLVPEVGTFELKPFHTTGHLTSISTVAGQNVFSVEIFVPKIAVNAYNFINKLSISP